METLTIEDSCAPSTAEILSRQATAYRTAAEASKSGGTPKAIAELFCDAMDRLGWYGENLSDGVVDQLRRQGWPATGSPASIGADPAHRRLSVPAAAAVGQE